MDSYLNIDEFTETLVKVVEGKSLFSTSNAFF